MRQRQCAKTQGQSLMVARQDIPWKKIHRHVFRLQKRMYRATQQGRVSIARKLQKLLVKSWYARLLAVRRISQDNRGKHTAGIDGVQSLTPAERWRLVKPLRLDSKATALRHTRIPKRGSAEKRPLGMPTQHARARQTLVRQALEPAWEAKLSPRTSVSQAVCERLDFLTWEKLRRWAHRRYPTKSAGWLRKRYGHQLENRVAFATSATDPDTVHLLTYSGVPITRHIKVRASRSPYDGAWVYWSTRQGRHPNASPRLAKLLKAQHGRCRYCGLFFQHDDRIEVDHINGDRHNARYTNLQALHGHCHDAKT